MTIGPARQNRRMTTEVAAPTVPIYLAGEFVEAGNPLEVRNPATGELVATTWQAGPEELERATVAAVDAFAEDAPPGELSSGGTRWPTSRTGSRSDADELAELLTRESGKPIRDARGEVGAAALTFRTAAEEALRINGEWLPLDWNAANRGRSGIVRRYPDRAGRGHQPVQLPAQPGRPQGGARARRRLHASSSSRRRKDPLVMLRIARVPGRDGPAEGCRQHPAHGSADRRPHGRATIASSCSASPARPASAGR